MKNSVLHIQYPDDLLLILKKDKDQFENEAKLLLAVKLYELGRISSGKASELAGLNRIDFLFRLKEYKVSPIQESIEEILEEAAE